MKKKLLSLALTGCLAAAILTGCGSGSSKDTYNVGICQLIQHPALDAATEGFKAALTSGSSVSHQQHPHLGHICYRLCDSAADG